MIPELSLIFPLEYLWKDTELEWMLDGSPQYVTQQHHIDLLLTFYFQYQT